MSPSGAALGARKAAKSRWAKAKKKTKSG